MNIEIQVIAIVGSLLVMYLVFHLIRRRKLREEYALLWFAASSGLIIFSFWRDLLHTVARLVGVAYPPTVLLLGMIVLGFLLAMHYSVSLSRLAEQNKRLTQEMALLRHQVDCLYQPTTRTGNATFGDEIVATAQPAATGLRTSQVVGPLMAKEQR